jgi:Na+/citrate or Na+/malate symporter
MQEQNKIILYVSKVHSLPVTVSTRSKTPVYGWLLAEIGDSIPTWGTDFGLLWLLRVVR